MTVKLSPQTEAALNAEAVQRGVDVAALIQQIVEEQLASVSVVPGPAQNDPTLALFDQWDREDAARTPEQIEADDRLWSEFEKGINASRQAQSMRLL